MKKIWSLKWEILFIVLFVLVRLPGLGHEAFNTDVWKWKSRIYDFGTGVFTGDYVKTIQRYHPGVTLMWVGSGAVKVFNWYYDVSKGFPPPENNIAVLFELHFVQKLFIVLTTAIVLGFTLYGLRKLFGVRYASLVGGLFVFEPFYVALTRVIHLEGMMSLFMIASFVWFYMYLKLAPRKLYLVVSAIFTGLAVLTKTSSLFMLPFIGLLAFVDTFATDKKFFRSLKTSLNIYWKWLLVFVITFVVLWPAMWTHAPEAFSALYKGIFEVGVEEGHEQFYFLKYTMDPGWTYYPVVIALRSSILLILGVWGYIFSLRKVSPEKRKFSIYVLLFTLLYVIFLTVPSKKLDRYVMPSILSLLMVAGLFYEWILEKAKKFALPLVIFLLIPAVGSLIQVHPDYFSYYNPLFGGIKTGVKVLEPKWMIGVPEIRRFLVQEKMIKGYEDFYEGESLEELMTTPEIKNKLVVGFDEKYYTQIWPFVREIGGWAVIQDLTGQSKNAQYFIYPVWDDYAQKEIRFKLEWVDVITVRGAPVYNVYERIF